MATFSIIPFSASTDFKGIKITTTASAGDTLHTAQASATLQDHMTLAICNTDTVDRPYTVQFGGTTSPDDKITGMVPSGMTVTIFEKKPIRNALLVKCFSGTITVGGVALTGAANVLVAHGWIQRELT